MSAAPPVVGNDAPPLTLRIDCSRSPIADLSALLDRAQSGEHAEWLSTVPVLSDPTRR